MAVSVEKMLLAARGHAKRGEIAQAEALYREVLGRFPGNKRAKAGLEALEQASKARPAAGPPRALVQQLMGLMQTGRNRELVDQANRALRIHPDTILLLEFRAAGQGALGDHAGAAGTYRRLIALRPDHADTHGNLGNELMELGEHEQAIAEFERVLALRPGDPVALNNEGNALLALGRHTEARKCFEAAVEATSSDVNILNNLGNLMRSQGDFAEARARLEKGLSIDPSHVFALNNLGNILLAEGDMVGAQVRFEAALAADPRYAEAWWNLSRLHRFAPDDPLLEQLEAQVAAQGQSAHDQMLLEFALAKALHDVGSTDRAFALWRSANASRKAELGYGIAQDRKLFSQLRRRFDTPHPPIPETEADRAAPVPIFLLGLPRSGTTLVEQIVTQHSQVAPGDEIATLDREMSALDWSDPEALTREAGRIRAAYYETLAGLADGEPFVTDKMPLNFRWIGAIRALFPRALFVHVHRDPRATLWSIYRNFFSSAGNGYAHDLDDLVAYHGLYRDLMAHWATQPGTIVDCDYEALTEDPEARSRALIEALGLPWEDACLRPQDNARTVATTSNTQVRKPIYRGSSQAWEKYAPHLEAAFAKLD
ncbi:MULTISPECIES: tetratricopeptide repeat-containing sulfotransferase family protein [Thioclava]|uniref:tetratricopeptide repeat-containing sulfotransferase family protein n=1 Tax=Thioclava TaxID=285107 RepID=UPI0023A809BE|nr:MULTISPECIES: tetratricopeptide repeat-containing sulfotransferase family protein [Thioclava]